MIKSFLALQQSPINIQLNKWGNSSGCAVLDAPIEIDIKQNQMSWPNIYGSDGSGPKNTGPGRARAFNVGLGPGPGLGPSLEAGPRAGPGLGPLPINKKNSNFT